MQNGLIFSGVLCGKNHIKWAAKGDRKAGEMMTLYVCPRANGSLDVKPEEVMVSSDLIDVVNAKLLQSKQFDVLFIQVDKQRDRLVFKSFIDIPKA